MRTVLFAASEHEGRALEQLVASTRALQVDRAFAQASTFLWCQDKASRARTCAARNIFYTYSFGRPR
jgi:hypothetical protein